jgi:hypothetical protein
MADPSRDLGMQYLYETQQQRTQTGKAAVRQQQQQQRPGSPVLAMAPLPQSDDASRDWGPAQGNLETAKMALDALRSLIMDAVFLDEEAYTNSATLQLYQQRLQVRCIRTGSCKLYLPLHMLT